MANRTWLIGLAGGSASGKTSIIRELSNHFDSSQLAILSLDNYYKPLSAQQIGEDGQVNFDDPAALDFKRLRKDVRRLMAGKSVEMVEYTFNNPAKFPSSFTINPAPLLLVEGLFVFTDPSLKKLFDWRWFVHTDLNQAKERRIRRDVEERGMAEQEVTYQWTNHVLPAYHNHVHPHLADVHLRIDNSAHYKEQLSEMIQEMSQVLEKQC